MPAITTFTTPRLLFEWGGLHWFLRDIIIWTLKNAWPTDIDFVPTSIHRTTDENIMINGNPHSPHVTFPHRALDARSRTLTNKQIVGLEQAVNARYQYDPNRPNIPVLLYHKGTALHFHFQVHPNTRIRAAS